MDNRLRGERRRRRRRSIRSGRAHFNWNSHDDRPSVPATDHKVLSTDWQSFVQLFSKSRWRTKVSAGLEIDIRPFLDRTESFLIYLISIQITLNLQINIDTSSQSRKVSGQTRRRRRILYIDWLRDIFRNCAASAPFCPPIGIVLDVESLRQECYRKSFLQSLGKLSDETKCHYFPLNFQTLFHHYSSWVSSKEYEEDDQNSYLAPAWWIVGLVRSMNKWIEGTSLSQLFFGPGSYSLRIEILVHFRRPWSKF